MLSMGRGEYVPLPLPINHSAGLGQRPSWNSTMVGNQLLLAALCVMRGCNWFENATRIKLQEGIFLKRVFILSVITLCSWISSEWESISFLSFCELIFALSSPAQTLVTGKRFLSKVLPVTCC